MGDTDMAELPRPWNMYAEQQRRLNCRLTVDDFAWGIEASLNALCDDASTISDTADLRRATATASRRERYRASLRRRRSLEVIGSSDWMAQASPDGRCVTEARSDLRHVERTVAAADLDLLVSIALGTDRGEVATSLAVTPDALRARLSRARCAAAKAVTL